MSWFTIPKSFVAETKAIAAEVNENFQEVADALNGLIKAGRVKSTSDLVLTSSWQDVPGAKETLVPSQPSLLIVTAIFDIGTGELAAANQTLVGELLVGGSAQTGQALFMGAAAEAATFYGARATVAQSWVVSLPAASREIKLRAKNTSIGTGWSCHKDHTGFTYLLLPDPSP